MMKLFYSVNSLLAIMLLSVSQLTAQTVNTTYSEGTGTAPAVSNSDLLQSYATLTSQSGSFTNEGTTSPTVLTDGTAVFDNSGKSGIASGSSLTYTFTSSPSGTEVTGVDIYSVWSDAGRLTPNVTVSYSLITAPNDFITLTTATFNPTVAYGNCWTKSSLAITGLTGLAAIKFDFPNQQNGYVGYNEIDVIGDAHISDTQNPTAPANLVSLTETNEMIYLGWAASTDDVGVLGYDVYKNGTLIGSTANTSFAVTGLTASTQYSFTVKAKDGSGKVSDASNTLVVSTKSQPNFVISYSEGQGIAPEVSNVDLLQTDATLTESTGVFTNEGAQGISALTNGVALFSNAEKAAISSNSSVTYTFNSSLYGYDLSTVNVYSTWQDQGRLTPNVTLSYSLISSPGNFITIANATFNPTIVWDAAGIWTKSSFALNNIVGVGAIRFDFPNQQNGYVGYNEIDVFGSLRTSTALELADLKKSTIYVRERQILVDLSGENCTSLVVVTDLKGSVIKSIKATPQLKNIQIQNKGIYFVKVQNAEKTYTQKVLVF